MFKRFLIGAILVASLSYLVSLSDNTDPHATAPPFVKGRNGTVLIMTNPHNGQANVHVATTQALLENYPDIEVHYASFKGIEGRLNKMVSIVRSQNPKSGDFKFHHLKGATYAEAVNHHIYDTIHRPGLPGLFAFASKMALWVSPWSVDDHLNLYQQTIDLINEIDPAVVVFDTFLLPSIDATRAINRSYAIISPNTLVDNFLSHQPNAAALWKYPCMMSGFKYPLPWRNVPENILLNFGFLFSVMRMPALEAKNAELRKRGIQNPSTFLDLHRPYVPWVSMDTENASIPVDVVPQNVTRAGPMIISPAPAAQQDPELTKWLGQAPTVMINLGSNFLFNEPRAKVMAEAVADVLSKSNVQVLWKLKKFTEYGDFSDDFLEPLEPFIRSDRARVSRWLSVDPSALMESGHIAVSVHHGGSNCYHEAIAAGVRHLILPLWADLYNFARLSETIGVGKWGCEVTSPEWTAECLSASMLDVIQGPDSESMKTKAKAIGGQIKAGEKGRDAAARVVASLAYA